MVNFTGLCINRKYFATLTVTMEYFLKVWIFGVTLFFLSFTDFTILNESISLESF